MTISILLTVGGLLALWRIIVPIVDAADQRRIDEQRPGDVDQLTRNLADGLIKTALIIVIGLILSAIALSL